MADDLDLENGDPRYAEESPRQRRRRDRQTSGSDKPKNSNGTETEIRSRLERVFDRIVKALEARGDEELATIIEEDAEQMAQGIISLTKNFTPLRLPILMFLNVLEPVLAFGRVARVLLTRFAWRRQVRMQEQEQANAEFEAQAGAVA